MGKIEDRYYREHCERHGLHYSPRWIETPDIISFDFDAVLAARQAEVQQGNDSLSNGQAYQYHQGSRQSPREYFEQERELWRNTTKPALFALWKFLSALAGILFLLPFRMLFAALRLPVKLSRNANILWLAIAGNVVLATLAVSLLAQPLLDTFLIADAVGYALSPVTDLLTVGVDTVRLKLEGEPSW